MIGIADEPCSCQLADWRHLDCTTMARCYDGLSKYFATGLPCLMAQLDRLPLRRMAVFLCVFAPAAKRLTDHGRCSLAIASLLPSKWPCFIGSRLAGGWGALESTTKAPPSIGNNPDAKLGRTSTKGVDLLTNYLDDVVLLLLR